MIVDALMRLNKTIFSIIVTIQTCINGAGSDDTDLNVSTLQSLE